MIGKLLRERLLEVAAVTNLVSSRIYPVILPQVPTYPAIVYEVVGTERGKAYRGPHNLVQSRVQLDFFADDYDEAWQIEDAVRTALNGYVGSLSGTKFWSVDFEDANDLYSQELKKWRVVSDYIFSFRDG